MGSDESGPRHSNVSDADLLRAIGDDLRLLYADVIKQPLPRNIEAALSRIDKEQNLAVVRREPVRTERECRMLFFGNP